MTLTSRGIPDFPGYQVTLSGVVFGPKGVALKPDAYALKESGYELVTLYKNGSKKRARVNRLVAEAFLPKVGAPKCVRHLNGIRTDNQASNLAWGSHKDNSQDAREHGTLRQGVTHPMAKFSVADIERIKYLRSCGVTSRELGKIYDVDRSTIGRVISNRTY